MGSTLVTKILVSLKCVTGGLRVWEVRGVEEGSEERSGAKSELRKERRGEESKSINFVLEQMGGRNRSKGRKTVQYSTVQYSTVQYSTVQYSIVQYSTVQYITPIHNITPHRTTHLLRRAGLYSWQPARKGSLRSAASAISLS